MKLGVENMLEAYLQDKRRTKDLERQLENYNAAIDSLTKRIDHIRMLAGKRYGCLTLAATNALFTCR